MLRTTPTYMEIHQVFTRPIYSGANVYAGSSQERHKVV